MLVNYTCRQLRPGVIFNQLVRKIYQSLVHLKKEPMARNTSILLGEHFEEFIAAKISAGKYNSAS